MIVVPIHGPDVLGAIALSQQIWHRDHHHSLGEPLVSQLPKVHGTKHDQLSKLVLTKIFVAYFIMETRRVPDIRTYRR